MTIVVVVGIIFLSYLMWPYRFGFIACNYPITLSENVPAVIDSCYRELGHKYQSVNVCNKITKKFESYGWDMRNTCLLGVAEVKQDYSICENTRLDFRDMCLYIVNYTLKNPKVCEIMSDYKNECYFILAGSLNDISMCDKIQTNLEYKKNCYRGFK